MGLRLILRISVRSVVLLMRWRIVRVVVTMLLVLNVMIRITLRLIPKPRNVAAKVVIIRTQAASVFFAVLRFPTARLAPTKPSALNAMMDLAPTLWTLPTKTASLAHRTFQAVSSVPTKTLVLSATDQKSSS